MHWIYYSENYLSIIKLTVIFDTAFDEDYGNDEFFSVTYKEIPLRSE